jgi:putative two-component system response regulator
MNPQVVKGKTTILVVEDDVEMAWMISSLLEREGYSAVVAQSGEEALDMLKPDKLAQPEPLARPDLIILDVLMEGLDGFQVCQRLKQDERRSYIPIVMVTVLDSLLDKVKGLGYGADDYVIKPFKSEELLARIEALLRVKRLHDELKRAGEELRQSYAQLRRTLEGMVNAWVLTIEIRDSYTAEHQRRVSGLACAIAKEIGLPEKQIEGIRVAGLAHDLGKLSIPLEILNKPGGLAKLEHAMIQAHPQVGYDVLKTVEFPWPVAQIVLQHHERLDGSGYPQGLSGEKILLEARILAVADVVTAMSSHRPSGGLWGIDKALEEISQNRGVLYDPKVVDACLKLFTEKGFAFE